MALSNLHPYYYPAAADRAHAQILNIANKGVQLYGVELKLGRKVHRRVEFPDGEGMLSAKVICAAFQTRMANPRL